MRRLTLLCLVALIGLAAAPAAASPQIAMHVGAHVGSKNRCDLAPATVPCADFTVQGNIATPYDVYLVAVEGPAEGIGGAEFTLRYTAAAGDGIDVFGWTPCGDQDFPRPGWPADGTGTTVTFLSGNCQLTGVGAEGPRAVLGALYVYAYDMDMLQLYPLDPSLSLVPRVFGCDAAAYEADRPSLVGFGTGGANPCVGFYDFFPGTCCLGDSCDVLTGPECFWAGGQYLGFVPCTDCAVPVERTTWGRIKARGGRED